MYLVLTTLTYSKQVMQSSLNIAYVAKVIVKLSKINLYLRAMISDASIHEI